MSAWAADAAVPAVACVVAVLGATLAATALVDARRAGRVRGRLETLAGPSARPGTGPFRPRRRRPPAVVERTVEDLALGWPASRVADAVVLAVAASAVGGLVLGGLPVAVLVVGGTLLAGVLVVVVNRGRRLRLIDRQLPGVVDRLGRALQSGATLSVALGAAGSGAPDPVRSELARVTRELAAGGRIVATLDSWAARTPTAGVRLLVAAASLGHEAGGAQARALDQVAATLRERLALQRETRALASQARASAALMVVAPVGFAAFTAATDAEVLGFLVGTPVGLVCLVVAVVLDGLGALWMARLTRGVG